MHLMHGPLKGEKFMESIYPKIYLEIVKAGSPTKAAVKYWIKQAALSRRTSSGKSSITATVWNAAKALFKPVALPDDDVVLTKVSGCEIRPKSQPLIKCCRGAMFYGRNVSCCFHNLL